MSIEEVRALVAERQRYDDWLAALEAKRTETPVRVFERVHGDYNERRSQVIAQLQSHVDSLATLGNDLEKQLDGLDAQLSALEDERAEAMLRNLVGEFDGDRWETVRVEVESKVETLTNERASVLTQFDDVRTLLASARVTVDAEEVAAPEAAEVAEVLTEAAAAPAEAVAEETDAADAEADLIEAAAAASAGVALTETDTHSLVDLGSQFNLAAIPAPDAVTESSAASSAEASVDAGLEVEAIFEAAERIDRHTPRAHEIVTNLVAEMPAAPQSAPPERSDAEFEDALAMFADTDGTPDAGFVRSLEGIEVEADEPPVSSAPRVDSTLRVEPTTATVTPPTAPNQPQANDGFDDLAFLRSVIDPTGGASAHSMAPEHALPTGAQAEPQKTLRCTECGTMNLPTEWYCERCGGELAAF
ncbi:MAG: hypothetical protein IBJ03_13870 [Gemmatimonadaceae bacterium]|nr:hypothetical protein [Gemmatimonadaceae bacterium]